MELIILELQEQHLLAELVEQESLELVVMQLVQQIMELLTEVVVEDPMVKHLGLIVMHQEVVVQALLF